MKKKINKKNVPAYAFGMDQLPNYLGGANVLGSAISGLSGEGSTGDAIGSTLGSAASLAGTGFSIGGPIGAAAGGVLGAAFGWIGSRRRKKQMDDAESGGEPLLEFGVVRGNAPAVRGGKRSHAIKSFVARYGGHAR